MDPELHRVSYAFDAAFQRMCEATGDDALMTELSNALHHLFRLRELCKDRLIPSPAAFYAAESSTTDLLTARGACWARNFDTHQFYETADLQDVYPSVYMARYGALVWKPLPSLPKTIDLYGHGRHLDYARHLDGQELLGTLRLWADAGLRPCPVMVWLPEHTGRFLDYLEETGERLSALYCVVAYCGLRRGEVLGLQWADVDLVSGVASVRETSSGDDPKSAAGVRAVPLAAPVVAALRAWRKAQSADQIAWGPDWPETGLVFTREDGTPVPGQWASIRFETLAWRADLPPIRFHDLRHGAASVAKAAGLDSKYISALLGHSRTSPTQRTCCSSQMWPSRRRRARRR